MFYVIMITFYVKKNVILRFEVNNIDMEIAENVILM